MKNTIRYSTTLLSVLVLIASCSSSTMINSYPSEAKVYMNGEFVGKTPYKHSDTKIVGSSTDIRLEKEGYENYNAVISRNEKADVGAIIGGVFTLVPFLWTMKYKSERSYDLVPVDAKEQKTEIRLSTSKMDELEKLKALFDKKVLTEEEFEVEKKKILNK